MFVYFNEDFDGKDEDEALNRDDYQILIILLELQCTDELQEINANPFSGEGCDRELAQPI
jgi:hypothetical protein